jgi:predicted amidohydrolase YtcJ
VSAPDLVLLAKRVLTMTGESGVEAVAVADGRIVGTGSRSELDRLAPAGTPILDAGGRTVCPGFVDPHAHGEVAARTIVATVDCRAPGCTGVGDVVATLRAHLDEADRGWLVGQGNLFFDQKLVERRLPTSTELDSVSTDVAIAVRAGGHVTVLNSRALELAGIDRGYAPPEHSVTGKPIVEREPDGRPTGVVKEMDNLLPLPEMDRAALREALGEGLRELFTRNGVTAIGEISETLTGLRAMGELQRTGELPLRVFAYLWVPGTVTLDEACAWPAQLDPGLSPLLRVQGVKLFADGGYSAASAAVKHDYAGQTGWRGALALDAEQIREALARTREAGLQLAIHANGDRAQEEVCAAIEAAGGAPDGRLRTRIEHAGNFAPERGVTTESWRRAGILPVPQPVFLYTFGDFFPVYLGPYGADGRFAFRSLLDEGWRISGSSDVWIGSERQATNPLFSVWCCLKRETFRGEIIDPHERITVEEALRMHTLHAAEALGCEDELGSIEPGKLADLVVLERDPATCADDDLPRIAVDAVLVEGRLVHERQGARPLARGGRSE